MSISITNKVLLFSNKQLMLPSGIIRSLFPERRHKPRNKIAKIKGENTPGILRDYGLK